jgi:hypothetical protein
VTEVLERLRDAQDGHDLDPSSPTLIRSTGANSRESRPGGSSTAPSSESGDCHSTSDLPSALPSGFACWPGRDHPAPVSVRSMSATASAMGWFVAA